MTEGHARAAWRSPGAWIVLLLSLSIVLCADLWTKSWAFETIAGSPVPLDRTALLDNPDWTPVPFHGGRSLIPGRLLDLRLVLNDGAIFGIGSHHRTFFILFTILALAIAGWIFARHTARRDYWAHVALGLVLGGGLGNLWDRVAIGRVRDFLYMLPDRHLPFGWSWPGGNTELFPWIFNVGDAGLMSGMAILVIYYWRAPQQPSLSADPADPPA